MHEALLQACMSIIAQTSFRLRASKNVQDPITCWSSLLHKPGLYGMPIVLYVCSVPVQQIHEIISTNLDPRKFSATGIWYISHVNEDNLL